MQVYNYKNNPIRFSFDSSTVMVNATEMAKPFGKKPAHFLRGAQTQRFIETFGRIANLQSEEIVVRFNGGNNLGTWMHEKLALKFAAWLSPEFELWVYDVFENHIKGGQVQNSQQPLSRMQILQIAMEAEKELQEARQENQMLQNHNNRLVESNYIMRPKVEYYDKVLKSASTYKTTIIAKELGMTARHLNKILKDNNIQYRVGGTWVLKKEYQNMGLTKTDTFVFEKYDGTWETKNSMVWTERGRRWLHELFKPQESDDVPF